MSRQTARQSLRDCMLRDDSAGNAVLETLYRPEPIRLAVENSVENITRGISFLRVSVPGECTARIYRLRARLLILSQIAI